MPTDSPPSVYISIGPWMRYLRRRLDLTQADLAERVGCALVTIKKIEQETRRPSREMAELLADILTVPAGDRARFIQMARHEGYTVHAAPGASAGVRDEGGSRHFVGRERELNQLFTHLNGAVNGSGRLVFITGEAGAGKSMLMSEFARQAQARYADLLVAGGHCDALAGLGDPYLPFRDILGLLTGDVTGNWSTWLVDRQHAHRLEILTPLVAGLLEEYGPDLFDVFVNTSTLLARVRAHAPHEQARWHDFAARLAQRPTSGVHPAQRQIYGQYIEVLRRLAERRPLLLFLDDLHWTDLSSAGLLFHLGRRLSDSRILIVGAYRPDEVYGEVGSYPASRGAELILPVRGQSADLHVAEGGDLLGPEGGARGHPLQPIVQEFRRRYGDILVDLDRLVQEGRRTFVDALLDREANQLDEAFRTAFVALTAGHPLFTVEMLRDLQERGILEQDRGGTWVQTQPVAWDTLPPRVEAVIGRRLDNLPESLRQILKVASVEGETFTAEVAAHVLEMEPRRMVRRLGDELGEQYRLVQSLGSRRAGTQLLSHYRFGHVLCQKYLYDHLDPAEKVYLHEAIGKELEQLYAEELDQVAVQLVHHFQAAGLVDKAITYLRMAGERAVRLSAHEEAIAHFTQALNLLATLPPTPARAMQEFEVNVTLGVSLVTTRGWPARATEAVYARIHELAQQIHRTPDMVPALSGLYYAYPAVYFVRGDLARTERMSRETLALAGVDSEPMLCMAAYAMLGPCLYHMGRLNDALAYTNRGRQIYEVQRRQSHVLVHGPDLGVFCSSYSAHICWTLGQTKDAIVHSEQALAIAKERAHPFSVVVASCYMAMLYQFMDDVSRVNHYAEAALALCTHYEFVYYAEWANFLLGWGLTRGGDVPGGIQKMRRALGDLRQLGTGLRNSYYLTLLAGAYGLHGEPQEGLVLVSRAREWAEAHEEHYYLAEVYRTEGELWQQIARHPSPPSDEVGDETQRNTQKSAHANAMQAFAAALAVAQRQGAQPFIDRAQRSLAR